MIDEADIPDPLAHGAAASSQARGQSTSSSTSPANGPKNASILNTVM